MMISKIVRTKTTRRRIWTRVRTGIGRTAIGFILTGFILQEVTEDERARWLRLLVILGIAGFILIFARDIINFLTGINMPTSISCASGSNVFITGIGLLPCDTVRAMVNLFNLARFAGVAVAAGGGAFAVVKL